MHIYDSRLRTKVDFVPIKEKRVKIYVCGPTVYDDAHLGHARSAISFDLLHRLFLKKGYEVEFAKNFTDIDDKIIKKVFETGETLEEITTTYMKRYNDEMDALHVLSPTLTPKATENLESMYRLIETLIEKGVAYQTTNGDVYFDVTKDSRYGTLSGHQEEETQSRVCEIQKELKKNEKDFALWKSCKKEDICFESPFGKGRPGWHLECSAMIKEHLAYEEGAYQIDIHCGGADLFFPHHENEEAQSSCAYENHLAKYWMHNGFVQINNEKMSKSLGNSFFIKESLKHFDGEVLRFYLMSIHYRAGFNYGEEDLLTAKKRLDKLYRLKKRIYGQAKSTQEKPFEMSLLEAMEDDLNISKALSHIDAFVQRANESLDQNPKNKALKQQILSNILFIEELLGFGGQDAYAYFQHGVDPALKTRIETLIESRNSAKASKNYAEADKIREEILTLGVQLQDTPQGTLWEKV